MDMDINTLVLGYLRTQNFNRTAKELEIESRHARKVKDVLSPVNGKEQLLPQLPSILGEYCAIKKAEKDVLANGPSSTIQTLWQQLDALIHQLKFISMGRQNNANTTHFNRGSNAARNSYYERVLASVSTARQAPQSTVTQCGNAPISQPIVNQQPIGPSIGSRPKQPNQERNSQRTSVDFDPTSPPRQQAHDREASEEHLSKSPKRKRIRPRKIASNEPTSAKGITLPISPDRNAQFGEQRSLESASQMLSSSEELNMIFDTLLNSKNLQEKIADNINKVATCTNLSTCDSRDAEGLKTANAHSTINVEEVLNMTRSDPSFESLFAALDDFETSPSTLPTPHKTFESSIPEMLPLAAEFDPLEDGGLASELSTHQDCAGSATRNLSSGEGETLQSCQTDQRMVESREVINAVSSSKEQMVKSPPRNDVGITNNRDAGRNSNPTSSMLPSNQVCSVYIKKNSHLSNTRNVRSVKGREQTTRKSTGTSKKVGTHAAGTEQNVVVDGTESSSNLKRIKSPSKNSLTGEFVANAVRRQLVCALVPSTEEPKRKDEKRRKKEKRSNATRNKTEEQGSNVRDDTIPPVSNNNESIDLNLITDRGDETGICGLEDSEQINDSCLQETASDPILHGENGENWSSIGENYDSEVPCQIQHSASFETEASKTEELETGASTASDSFEQARPDETACGGSFLDQDGCNRDTADVSIHDSATGGSSQLLDSAEKRRQREDTVARRIRARRNLAKTDMSPEFGMRIQGNRRNDHTNKNVDIHEEMTEFDDREIGRANFDVQDMYSVSSPKDIVDCGPSPGSCDVLEQVEISPKDMSDCGPSPGSCNIFEQFELLKPEQIGRTVRFDLTEKAGHRVKNKAGNRLVGEGDEKGGPESGLGSGSECNSRTDVGSLCGKTPLKSILKKSRGSKSASLQKDIGLLHEKRVAEFSSMDGRSGGRAEDKHKGGFNEVAVIAKGSAASEMNVCKVEQNVNKLNYLISQNVEYTTNGDPNGDVHEDPKITESVKCHANSPDGNTPKYKESTKEAFDSQGERDTDKNPQAASKMDPFPGYLKILTSPKDNRLEYTVKELESAQRGDWKEQDADSLVKCLSSWRSKSKADDLGKCWSSPRRKKVVELPDIEKGPTDIFGDRKGADSPEESRGPVLRTSPRRKKNSENVNDNEEVNGKGHGNSKQGLSEIPLIKENAREKASKHLETKRGSNLKRGGKDSGILEKQKEERAPKKSSRKKKNKKDHNVKARSNSSRRDIWIRTDDPVQDNFSAGSFTGDRNRAMGHGLKNDNKECLAALADQGGSLKESSLEKGALESADENLNEQSKEESVIFDGCQCDEILQKNIGDEVGRKSFAKRLSSPRKVNKIVIKHASVGEVAKDDESSRGVDDVILPQGVKERSNDMEFSFNESASDTQGLQSTTGSGMQGASNDVIECTQGVQNDVVSGTQKSPSDTEGSLRIVGANEDYLCIEVVEEEKFDGILAMSEPVSGVDDSQIYIIVEAFDTDANKAEDSLKIEGDLVDAGKQNIGWLVDERIVKDKDSARLEIPCNHSGLVISQSDSVAKQDADYSLSNLDYRNPLSRTTSEETESKTQASDYSRSDLDYRNTLSRVTSEEKKSKKSITNQSTLTDNVTQVADYSRSELDYRDSESKSNKETESTRSSADDSCDLSGANPSIGSAGNDLVNALGAIDDNATQGYSPIKDRMIDLSNHDCQSPYNHPSDSTDGLGFKILSRDVTSDVSDSSNHESNFLEMYGRQKDNFVIYLSDDSNDSSRDQVIAKDKKGKTGVEENSNDVIEDDRTINDQVNTKLDSVSEQANTEDATQINEDKCDFVIDGKQSISDRFDFDNQTKLGHGKLGSNHTNASHHVRDDDIITTVRVKNDCVLVNDQAGNVIKDGQARTAMVTNSDCIHDSTRPLVSNTKRKEGNITVSEEAANVNPMNKSVSTAASTKSVNEKSHLIPQQLLIANEEECVDRQSFPSCVSTEGMNIDRQNEFSCEPARGLNIEKETKTTRKKLHKKSRSRKRKASGTHSVESSQPRKKQQTESDITDTKYEIPQDLDIESFLSNLDYSS